MLAGRVAGKVGQDVAGPLYPDEAVDLSVKLVGGQAGVHPQQLDGLANSEAEVG